jgi:AcrR family transcriptional regulator
MLTPFTPRRADERILAAARAICRRDGVEGLSMRRIASAIGVTAPAIYRHYRSKEQLLRAVADDGLRTWSGYLDSAARGRTAVSRLRALIAGSLAFAVDHPELFDLMFFEPGSALRSSGSSNGRAAEHNPERLEREVEAGIRSGALAAARSAGETSVAIWALLVGLIALRRAGRFGTDPARFRRSSRRAVDALLASLSRGGSGEIPGTRRSARGLTGRVRSAGRRKRRV